VKIRAAVARATSAPLSLETVDLEDPRDDEICVRLVAAGVCHTDIAMRDQVFPVPQPVVLGHEGAGVVERVGLSVTRVVPGDHVLMSYHSCGSYRASLSSRLKRMSATTSMRIKNGGIVVSLAAGPMSGRARAHLRALSDRRSRYFRTASVALATVMSIMPGCYRTVGGLLTVCDRYVLSAARSFRIDHESGARSPESGAATR
jgi:hypothetical protein